MQADRKKERVNFSFLFLFFLFRPSTDDGHPHSWPWRGQSTLLTTNSNADLIWKHLHKIHPEIIFALGTLQCSGDDTYNEASQELFPFSKCQLLPIISFIHLPVPLRSFLCFAQSLWLFSLRSLVQQDLFSVTRSSSYLPNPVACI